MSPSKESEEKPTTKVCSKCQSTQDYENNYCTECGQRIANLKYCPKCGKEMEEFGLMCECGYQWPEMKILANAPRPSTEPAGSRKIKRSDVDKAWEGLGVTDKMLKEHGMSKEQILGELKSGTKPKDDVIVKRDATVGHFETNS